MVFHHVTHVTAGTYVTIYVLTYIPHALTASLRMLSVELKYTKIAFKMEGFWLIERVLTLLVMQSILHSLTDQLTYSTSYLLIYLIAVIIQLY
jgi:hypothetical protein